MKIAITGNIGSGKTEVIKFLLGLKYKCISSDKIIADLYKDSSTRKIILHKLNIPDDNLLAAVDIDFINLIFFIKKHCRHRFKSYNSHR